MKHLTYILLLFSALVTAQIELSVYQDAKLAVIGDDKGNDAFTTDLVVIPRMYNGGTRAYNWTHQIFVYPYFEYADLQDGRYLRYAMGVGYRFKLPLKINVSPSFDYGAVNRWGSSAFSYNLGLDISYQLTKKLAISTFSSITERPHLRVKWGTQKPTYNFYVGATYLIAK